MIELLGRDDPEAGIFRLVNHWLYDKCNGRWLLLLDNANDDNVFASTTAKPDGIAHGIDGAAMNLARYSPQSANGWILVTSRDRLAAVDLVGAANVTDVEPMAEKEALMLLQSHHSPSGLSSSPSTYIECLLVPSALPRERGKPLPPLKQHRYKRLTARRQRLSCCYH